MTTDELAGDPYDPAAVKVNVQLRAAGSPPIEIVSVPLQLTDSGLEPDQKAGLAKREQDVAFVDEYVKVTDPPADGIEGAFELIAAVADGGSPCCPSDKYFRTVPPRPLARTQKRHDAAVVLAFAGTVSSMLARPAEQDR